MFCLYIYIDINNFTMYVPVTSVNWFGPFPPLRPWHGEPYSARRWRASDAQKALLSFMSFSFLFNFIDL